MDLIEPPATQLRATIDPQRVQDLADSMARVGLLQPILIRHDGVRFRIVAGHRRFLAAQLLGWRVITCQLHEGDDTPTTAISLHENLFREQLTPLEEAALCQELVDTEHLDPPGIARRLRHSEQWVQQRLAIMQYPDDVLAALHTGTLNVTTARIVAAIDDAGYRATVLEAADTHGMTERHALSWRAQFTIYRDALQRSGQATMPTPAEIDADLQYTVCDVHGGRVYANVTKLVRICFDCWKAIQTGATATPDPR